MQTRERLSKTEAIQILLKENPNKMNYAKTVKQDVPSTSANSDALDNDLDDKWN